MIQMPVSLLCSTQIKDSAEKKAALFDAFVPRLCDTAWYTASGCLNWHGEVWLA